MKSRVRNIFIFAVALFLFGHHCFAQHINDPELSCSKNQASNAEETTCFITASQVTDKKLNQIYTQILKFLSAQGRLEDQQNLKHAQRIWLQYRDANCATEKGIYKDGSAAPMVYAACMQADTQQRIDDLKTIYGWLMNKFDTPLEE
jgi:uncharacterized protein YecT (DUF1311 family)